MARFPWFSIEPASSAGSSLDSPEARVITGTPQTAFQSCFGAFRPRAEILGLG